MKKKTPKSHPNQDFYEAIEQACEALKRRNGAPPWKNHPRKIDFELYYSDELSTRTRRHFEAHIEDCRKCRAKMPKPKKEPAAKCGICNRRLIPGDGGTYCMTCQYRMDHDSR